MDWMLESTGQEDPAPLIWMSVHQSLAQCQRSMSLFLCLVLLDEYAERCESATKCEGWRRELSLQLGRDCRLSDSNEPRSPSWTC